MTIISPAIPHNMFSSKASGQYSSSLKRCWAIRYLMNNQTTVAGVLATS